MKHRKSATVAVMAVLSCFASLTPTIAQTSKNDSSGPVINGVSSGTIGAKGTTEGPLKSVIRGSNSASYVNPDLRIQPSKNNVQAIWSLPISGSEVDGINLSAPRIRHRSITSNQKAKLQTGKEKVRPGKVDWYDDLELALAASKQSKRPVLLFQMMGHMDDRFC